VTALRLLGFCVVASGVSVSARATDSNGTVIGRVVDALTGKGVARARIVVTVKPLNTSADPVTVISKYGPPQPQPPPPDRVVLIAGDDGSFRISHLPAASLDIFVERPGYVLDLSGNDARARRMFSVSGAGDPVSLTLMLTPQAVIAGKAMSPQGDSVARVRLWKRDEDGRVNFHSEKNTDRTGEFRFANLAPGRYYIEVSPLPSNSSGQENPAYLHRFFEDSVTIQTAKPIDVSPGQTENLSIRLRPAQGYTVHGRYRCSDTAPFIALYVSDDQVPLIPARDDFETRTFTLTNVAPGNYLLKANCTVDGKTTQRSVAVTVSDSDLNGVEFPTDH
jgi:hypothetical protein